MKKILMTITLAAAAMIAIPTIVKAQDATPQQCKECTKTECQKTECKNADCKDCPKEAKACSKAEGKACCKKGSMPKRMAKGGKMIHADKNMHVDGRMHADRRMNSSKEIRMHKGMHRKGGENPLFKGITLNEDQQQKMNALREKRLGNEGKVKADMKAKSKEEMKKIREDFDKEVENILDKDQLKQYKANKAEMDARRAEKQTKLPKLEKKDK